ncbi:MAG: hypothetical protein ACKPGJ_04850 [Dolichospermum sp.]
MIQDYLNKINSHNWTNDKLKFSLILATYVNYALIEYGENVGIAINIDLKSIIDSVIESDSEALLKQFAGKEAQHRRNNPVSIQLMSPASGNIEWLERPRCGFSTDLLKNVSIGSDCSSLYLA